MRLPLYHLDAFAARPFAGNPAAVVPLERWLPDAVLQQIAAENNLAETAFFVGKDGRYQIRWMTPATEVDLCGHATLAAAFVVLKKQEPARPEVVFDSKSGPLRVFRDHDRLALDFPSRPPAPAPQDLESLAAALGGRPRSTEAALRDALAVFESEDEVRGLRPDMTRLIAFGRPVIASAAGREADFVSRFFAPGYGVPEDPVTGSAHCTLAPYWSKRLGKKCLRALQVSARGGELVCEDRGERVFVAGRVVPYLEGTIEVPEA
jgi:PhzF family phenazine biosynthesis protein